MALSVQKVKEMSTYKLGEAIKLCELESKKYEEDQPSKAEKFRAMAKVFSQSQKRLENIIETLAKTTDPSTQSEENPTGKTYLQTIFEGKREGLTYGVIASRLEAKNLSIDDFDTSGVKDSDVAQISNINLRTNFVDMGKDFVNDAGKGKGRALGFTKVLFGYGIIELATTGITKILATKGILANSMNLFGVLKLGFNALPGFFSGAGAFLAPIIGSNPVGFAAILLAGGFAVLPFFKKKVDNIVQKINTQKNAQQTFEANIDKIGNEAPQATK